MEKTFSLKLTEEQKEEISKELGIPIEQVGFQVAYAEAFDEDAKGNDQIVASVPEKASDGKVWVIEALGFQPQKGDGSPVFYDMSNVTGGLQGGYIATNPANLPPLEQKTIKVTPLDKQGGRKAVPGTK